MSDGLSVSLSESEVVSVRFAPSDVTGGSSYWQVLLDGEREEEGLISSTARLHAWHVLLSWFHLCSLSRPPYLCTY